MARKEITAAEACAAVSRLQFAPVSRWEEALSVEKGFTCADEVRGWLARLACSQIGAEAFFETEGYKAFIGVRLPFSQDVLSMCVRISEEFLSGRAFAVGDFIRFAEGFSRAPLYRGEPDFMELGLVNMWKSFGALTFRKSKDVYPPAKLKEALTEDTRYTRLLPAPPAMECAWDFPLPHWTGRYLSRAADGGYLLDIAAAEKFFES